MRLLETTAAAFAVLIGIGVAIASTRLISIPLFQTAAAALAGWLLGSLVGTVLWLRHPAPEAPVLAVKWTFPQVLMGTAVVVLGAMAFHAAFSVANLIHPSLGSWRHLIAAVTASLAGCMGYASGIGFGEPLK